jgi:hypothetical protein
LKSADKSKLIAVLNGVYDFYRQELTGFAIEVWLSISLKYGVDETVKALSAHLYDKDRGRFMPTPADIVKQLSPDGADGRPGPEEAWAMCPLAERDSAVWTDEMAQAFGVVAHMVERNDQIGARMAFKEAYARLVTEARADNKPTRWVATLGTDHHGRHACLKAAVAASRIGVAAALELDPSLTLLAAPAGLPALPAPEISETGRRKVAEMLLRMGKPIFEPKAWARKLKAREAAGEPLSQSQRESWRAALHSEITHVNVVSDMIQPSQLPPAMRPANVHRA